MKITDFLPWARNWRYRSKTPAVSTFRDSIVWWLKLSDTLPWPTIASYTSPILSFCFPILCCPMMVPVVPEKDMLRIIQLRRRKAWTKAIWGTTDRSSISHSSSSLFYSRDMKGILWNLFLFFPKAQNQENYPSDRTKQLLHPHPNSW